MNTYRKTLRIMTIMLLVVFIFAATQPLRAYTPYKTTHTTIQGHLENLVVSTIPDWQTATFHVKTPDHGSTWNFSRQHSALVVWYSHAFDIRINKFSYIFSNPSSSAP